MEKKELTQRELKELCGGMFYYVQAKIMQDELNHNTTQECRCQYSNMSIIENKNEAQSCKCLCK